MSYFYLSFCDTTKPKGQQFLGACVVKARSAREAHEIATALGLNPGGEIAMAEMATLPEAGRKYLNRFVPREEVMSEAYHTIDEMGDGGAEISSVCQDHNPAPSSSS